MALFYTDEHVPSAVVDVLRVLGHDVLTALQDGRANQGIGDTVVLNRAMALGRAIVTNNRRHFRRLHHKNPNHAGIVTYTDDPDRPAIAHRIDAAVAPLPTLAGLLVRVTRPNPSQRGPATQPP
jgi:ABC-type amino acid transport substrate-binding protein